MSSGHEQPDSVTRFETALVVDNDAIMVKFMRKLLNEAGLTVVTAQDGLAALDLLTSIRPDLILVDLVMPNIDGRALCRIIRSKPDFAKIPIVVISAIASEEDFNAADLGANACIAKGTFTDIAVHVNTLLDNPELLTDNRLGGKILGIKKLFPRRTTEELLDTSRHYQVMLDSITNGILEVNANHRVIFCNPAALSIFSLTREQLLGRHIDQLFNTDAILVVGRLLSDKRLKDSDPDARITVRGREIDVSAVSTQPDSDNWIIIMDDITEREEARTALLLANRELYSMAKSDGLTQIANRRHFDELLEREWRRMHREKGTLTIMLFDVDHFKDFNDNYGHLQGDQCLRDMARLIRDALRRPSDQAARYGGDEFAGILPNTPPEGAAHLAKKIQHQVTQLAIRHEFSPVSDLVTLTIGAGCGSPHAGISARDLVSLADKALYAAKQQGRNCAVTKVWEPPAAETLPQPGEADKEK